MTAKSGTVRKKRSRGKWNAFISHASQDARFVRGLTDKINDAGVRTWYDDTNVRYGGRLRNNLHIAIRDSRTLVLFWSNFAAQSRWVNAELVMAFQSNRFVIPCVLDDAPLPQFLQNEAYLDRKRDKSRLAAKLIEAIRTAPNHRNDVAPLLAAESPKLRATTAKIETLQRTEMDLLGNGDVAKAQTIHATVAPLMAVAERTFKYERAIMNLSGYHRKNDYMLRHWDAVQAGQLIDDPILVDAERCFFNALRVDPWEMSAINGLASILMFERELDVAEFLQRRAIRLAKDQGFRYEEAEQDLALVLYYKKQARAVAQRR